MPVLPLRVSREIDELLRRPSAEAAEADVVDGARPTAPTIVKYSGKKYLVEGQSTTDSSEGSVPASVVTAKLFPLGRLGDVEGDPLALCHVPLSCSLHPERMLSVQAQTDVWPFSCRPTCSVVTDGHPCSRSTGEMFRCGYCESSLVDGVEESHQCVFALCSVHYKAMDIETRLRSKLTAVVRQIQESSPATLFSASSLFLCTNLFTPFVKTAVMMLSCHPYYQCQLGKCWADMNQFFTLVAYLCVTVIAFLGVAFPCVLTMLLWRRRTMMGDIFFAPEYHGLYTEQDCDGDDNAPNNRQKYRNDNGTTESSARAAVVDPEEWSRFVSTDFTALAVLYKDFKFEWIFIAPVLLAWKVVLLCPPIFLEQNSFNQYAGIAATEFLFALFIQATAPSSSTLVNGVYRIGGVHQMLFVGCMSYNVYARFTGSSQVDSWMILVTFLYLGLCLASIVVAIVLPTIDKASQNRRLTAMLRRWGITYSLSVNLYMTDSAQTHVVEG